MCYAASCNPECGKCKPRRIVHARCPQCGASCTISREEYLIAAKLPHTPNIIEKKLLERGEPTEPRCGGCGAPLLDAFREQVEPLPCTYSGIVCGFPCGNHTQPAAEGARRCPNMVPLGKFSEPEVPRDMRPWETN